MSKPKTRNEKIGHFIGGVIVTVFCVAAVIGLFLLASLLLAALVNGATAGAYAPSLEQAYDMILLFVGILWLARWALK